VGSATSRKLCAMATRYEPPPTAPLLYSVNDLAHALRVSRALVYRLVRAGELTPVRVGDRLRFRLADVEAYLDRHRIAGRAP